MIVIHDANEMSAWSYQRRMDGDTIGFVPTMGYLHEGHLDLCREVKKRCDRLVVSIFVNPMQFNNPDDLENYPRDEEGDLKNCKDVGTDVVYMPAKVDMYPDGYQTKVTVTELTQGLCGLDRPGHFQGVTTIVAKLLNIVQPNVSVFGQKDYQQLAAVSRMVKDLNFPVEIVGYPTVRESDGMAMSSRNARLLPHEREQACVLSKALFAAKAAVDNGETDASQLIADARSMIEAAGPCTISYIEIVDAELLQTIKKVSGPSVMALGVGIGAVRLIDNLRLK